MCNHGVCFRMLLMIHIDVQMLDYDCIPPVQVCTNTNIQILLNFIILILHSFMLCIITIEPPDIIERMENNDVSITLHEIQMSDKAKSM